MPHLVSSCTSRSVSYRDRNSAMHTHTNVVCSWQGTIKVFTGCVAQVDVSFLQVVICRFGMAYKYTHIYIYIYVTCSNEMGRLLKKKKLQ